MPEYKQYKKKPAVIEAVQWFRNGDHPADESKPIDRPGDSSTMSEGKIVREFRALHIPGNRFCQDCGNAMHKHGVITTLDGTEETVHPGDYIVTDPHGRFYRRAQKDFENNFEPFDGVEVDVVALQERVQILEEQFQPAELAGPEVPS